MEEVMSTLPKITGVKYALRVWLKTDNVTGTNRRYVGRPGLGRSLTADLDEALLTDSPEELVPYLSSVRTCQIIRVVMGVSQDKQPYEAEYLESVQKKDTSVVDAEAKDVPTEPYPIQLPVNLIDAAIDSCRKYEGGYTGKTTAATGAPGVTVSQAVQSLTPSPTRVDGYESAVVDNTASPTVVAATTFGPVTMYVIRRSNGLYLTPSGLADSTSVHEAQRFYSRRLAQLRRSDGETVVKIATVTSVLGDDVDT
jgi:hypothetical protein